MNRFLGIVTCLSVVFAGTQALSCYQQLTQVCDGGSSCSEFVRTFGTIDISRTVVTCQAGSDMCLIYEGSATKDGSTASTIFSGCFSSTDVTGGVEDGCYQGDELASVFPSGATDMEQQVSSGFTYDNVVVCICSSNLCNVETLTENENTDVAISFTVTDASLIIPIGTQALSCYEQLTQVCDGGSSCSEFVSTFGTIDISRTEVTCQAGSDMCFIYTGSATKNGSTASSIYSGCYSSIGVTGGVKDGCYQGDELATLLPIEMGQQVSSGFTYDNDVVCICSSNLCNVGNISVAISFTITAASLLITIGTLVG